MKARALVLIVWISVLLVTPIAPLVYGFGDYPTDADYIMHDHELPFTEDFENFNSTGRWTNGGTSSVASHITVESAYSGSYGMESDLADQITPRIYTGGEDADLNISQINEFYFEVDIKLNNITAEPEDGNGRRLIDIESGSDMILALYLWKNTTGVYLDPESWMYNSPYGVPVWMGSNGGLNSNWIHVSIYYKLGGLDSGLPYDGELRCYLDDTLAYNWTGDTKGAGNYECLYMFILGYTHPYSDTFPWNYPAYGQVYYDNLYIGLTEYSDPAPRVPQWTGSGWTELFIGIVGLILVGGSFVFLKIKWHSDLPTALGGWLAMIVVGFGLVTVMVA